MFECSIQEAKLSLKHFFLNCFTPCIWWYQNIVARWPLCHSPLLYSKLVVFYAELFPFISRYNGSLPNGDRGRRKSRFALYKRSKASGVKPSTVHVISTPQASKVCDTGQILGFDGPEWRITRVFLLIYLAASLFCACRMLLFNEEAAVDLLSGVCSCNPVTCLK